MSKVKIPSEDAQCFYHEQTDDTLNGFRFVDIQFAGEWRWGNSYQLIIQDALTDKFYSTIVQEQTGDHWYLSLENKDEVTFEEVERLEKITYEYKKVS